MKLQKTSYRGACRFEELGEELETQSRTCNGGTCTQIRNHDVKQLKKA